MKNRAFVIFAGIILLAFVGFLVVTWPYRGILPNVIPVPSVPSDASTSTGNTTGLPLKLPEGFSMNIFAKDMVNPRVIEADLADSDLLVSVPSEGKVMLLSDADHDGVAETKKTVLENLKRPHGLEVAAQDGEQNVLFVAESNKLSRYNIDLSTYAVSNQKTLVNLPDEGRHWTKTLQLEWPGDMSGPPKLLISIGSSCDVCRETDERRGTIYSIDSAGDGSDFGLFAKGLRNAVFMTQRVDGKVWATEMGRDFLGDDLPPDEINIIEKDANYGWPICYGKNIHDTQFDKNVYIRNPCMEPFETPSKIDLPAHSAPLGLAFVPANAGWPEEYEGNLLVAYHGSWNRSEPTGYKIRRFILDGAGNTVRDEDFVSGWLDERGVLGRPADLKFDSSGALFVSDDRAGVIYRITPPK